jgi:hypothetical protein
MSNVHSIRGEEGVQAARQPATDAPISLQMGDGDGTSGGMSTPVERIARLEGGTETLKWAVGAVSAAFIAVAAIIIGLQTVTISRVSELDTKLGNVEAQMRALPDQINRNLLELNRTLSQAITATQARQTPAQQPTVIVVPSDAVGVRAPGSNSAPSNAAPLLSPDLWRAPKAP